MKGEYTMQHEEAELAAEITKNYEQYASQDQTRRPNGQLIDPLAETFERRMNRALESYGDLARFAGQATLIGQPEGA